MSSETDGFEIQRPGSEELDIVIQLHLYNNPHKFQVSRALERIIGLPMATRTNILAGIWEYIKINRLQDQESREFINCDSALKEIFGVDKVQINHILAKIKGHISNPEPIEISHRIKLDPFYTRQGDNKNNEQVYDLKVEFDYPFSLEILPFFSKHVNAAEELSQGGIKNSEHPSLILEQKLKRMEKKQIEMVEKMKRHLYKRDNYQAFAENPLSYIDSLIMQQNSLLKIIKEESIFDNVENPENPQFLLACEDFVVDEIRKQLKTI